MPRATIAQLEDPERVLTPANNYALRFAAIASLQAHKEAVMLRKNEIDELTKGINELKALCEALLSEKKEGVAT